MDCLLSVSYPVAIKDHRCDCCGKRISKGQRQEVQKQIFDGRPRTYRAHDDCAEAEQRARDLARILDALTTLRAENERLTKALKQISIFTDCDNADNIARAALNPTAHYSDCATNNAPALPVGLCNCGGYSPDPTGDK